MRSFAATLSEVGRESARIVLCSPCVVCEQELPWNQRIGSCCRSCWKKLPRIDHGKCLRCALPWQGDPIREFLCVSCLETESDLEWIDAWGRYSGGLDLVLQKFKFSRHDFLGRPLAELLAETWRSRDDRSFDAAVAVPMHRARRRRRGFNQAELLAREFARLTGIPHRSSILTRELEGATQASLPREERAANVRGVYRANPEAAAKSILLIDDICTTGATLRACARALTDRKASRVCALVVARA